MPHISDIHFAVIDKDIIKCKKLLENKNNINLKTSYDMTPLLYACCGTDNFDIIKLLIQSGANINDIDNHGDTPLLTLCRVSCNLQTITYLIENGANIKTVNNMNSTCLTIASANSICSIECLDYLIQQIDQTNCKSFIKHVDNNNCFFSACIEGNINIMNYLLQYDFNVNEKNNSGLTCLMCAFCYLQNTNNLFYNNVENIVNFLIQNKYDINTTNNHGENILCVAMKGYHNIIKNYTYMTNYGDISHIKISAYENAYSTFVYLIKKGALVKYPCYEVAEYLKFDNIVNFINKLN